MNHLDDVLELVVEQIYTTTPLAVATADPAPVLRVATIAMQVLAQNPTPMRKFLGPARGAAVGGRPVAFGLPSGAAARGKLRRQSAAYGLHRCPETRQSGRDWSDAPPEELAVWTMHAHGRGI